ncbi:MAG: S41 family peptidase [Planctomycetota bacterium]
MRRAWISMVAAAMACSVAGQDGGSGNARHPGKYAADAELLIGAFSEIHPGYTRYASAELMEAEADRLRAASAVAESEGAFYLAVQRYLASIRCEHTEAEPSDAVEAAVSSSLLPLDFAYALDDSGAPRAIVVGLSPGVEGVRVGDELVAVDGRPMGDLFEAIRPFISVDGFTDHTRLTLFAGEDDYALPVFELFATLLFDGGDARESWSLTLASADGAERTVAVAATDMAGALAARGRDGTQKNFSDPGAVSWERMGDAAVLRVSTFVNYRTPIEAMPLFAEVFREIKASGVERLVFDMREIGGGSGDVQRALVRHLLTGPMNSGGPTRVRTYDLSAYREHMRTWNPAVFEMPAAMFEADDEGFFVVKPPIGGSVQTVEPAPDAWDGELVLLVGPNNESGATWLIAELREQRELLLVGEPTGGSAEGPTAGIIVFLTLPESGIVARLPLLDQRTSATDFEPGMGVTPDAVVRPSVADLRAGRDVALERAVLGTDG